MNHSIRIYIFAVTLGLLLSAAFIGGLMKVSNIVDW